MRMNTMDETKRNSMRLDIEAVRLSENDHDQQPTETYKQVSEFNSNEKSTAHQPANMTREKGDNVEDGADEKMLASDDKEQLARKDEVKFIASDRSNGDAKIDIGNIEKSFTGMTKEELMKYANDPFWQRLRWIFFILFWLLWAAMLAGAIWIILKAPKCSVARPLSWYKEGPLIEMPKNAKYQIFPPKTMEQLQSIDAKGVIYNLPADKTYSLDTKEVQDYIKEAVEIFKNTNIKVIFDLTPNYVTTDHKLYQLAGTNETYRSAFVWKETARFPNNWLSKVPNAKTNGSAWQLAQANNYVLSQFGENNIDLQMNDPIVKDLFKDVLRQLARMGVSGFRLANAKHYIINKNIPDDQSISRNPGAVHTDYSFWTHSDSTNQPGLGDLLHEFWQVVHNETNGDGFLSVSDYIEAPNVFHVKENTFGFDLPILVNLTATLQLSNDSSTVAKKLYNQLSNTFAHLDSSVWLQWPYEKMAANSAKIGTSEYNIFLFLLPGVPVGSIDDFTGAGNETIEDIKKLESFRKTPSYQHGKFHVYSFLNDTVIAYTRLKSGNPGYFVVYNPTDANVVADFSSVESLPEQLTVELASKPYENDTVNKLPTNAIPLQANSAVVFTYAPKSAA